jgi:hypothetical protein
MGASLCHKPVKALVTESDKGPQRVVNSLKVPYENLRYGLLRVLHRSRFHSDDSRCLERFRNCDNPHGYLSSRFEDVHMVKGVSMPLTRRDKPVEMREH